MPATPESETKAGAVSGLLTGLAALCIIHLLASALVHHLELPIPGAVMGLVILLLLLLARQQVPGFLQGISQLLLNNLALLYVPAGVGLMTQSSLLADEGWILLLALFISTAMTLVVSAVIMKTVLKPTRKGLND